MNRFRTPDIGRIRLSNVLFNIVTILIIFNNIVYQTGFQLNQPFFVFLTFTMLFIMFAATSGLRHNNWFYILLFLIFSYMLSSILLNMDQREYMNRALFNFMAASVYLMLFFVLSKRDVSVLYLYVFSVIFIAGGVYISVTSDRDLFNPNWYAMTMFYLFALIGPREKKWLVFIMALIFLGSYGSRGATLSAIVAFVVIVITGLLEHRRYILSLGFMLLTVGMFYFVYYLYDSRLSVLLMMSDIVGEGRGLGGREGALIEAFSQLVESKFLGYGIGASTSFSVQDNIGLSQDVHVHFGLLDIFLQFGVGGILFIYYFVNRLIRTSNTSYLPYVMGGLMTVLYYNGLATSHLGLNFLLYLLLGQAFHRTPARRSPHGFRNFTYELVS